ncbi:MAG: Trm112 family protein [Candidatus Omnitrophica bacterium]|nr:Trm112 family protein [Candidatus Omnitrophota bacterium]
MNELKERQVVISQELLNILVCPACKEKLRIEGEKIKCTKCNRSYPVRNGIPIMLIEEAERD